jgi:hypothetical protein
MSTPLGSSQWMYATGVEEGQSLRFNDDESQYLSWTPAAAGNRKTWTWSGWIKRGESGDGTGSNHFFLFNASTDNIDFYQNYIRFYFAGGGASLLTTTQVFRDYSAWYHLVFAVDTTQANAVDRIKIYVNGEQITSFSSSAYPALNYQGNWNSAVVHNISKNQSTNYFSGYLSDVHFIDGQALDATSFGETIDGYWKAKNYSGSYGTNGFRLEFDGDTTDSSGNGNDWTANNISAHDYVPDSPTNNFATLNPLAKGSGTITFSEGNLKSSTSVSLAVAEHGATFTIPKSGKWYWEAAYTGANTGGSQAALMGIMDIDTQTVGLSGNHLTTTTGDYITYYTHNSGIYENNVLDSSFSGNEAAATVGFALDMDNGYLFVHLNGTYIGGTPNFSTGANHAAEPNTTRTWLPFFGANGGSTITWTANFGQDSTFAGLKASGSANGSDDNGIGDFYYAVPAGYLSLCSASLPTPTIVDGSEHFNTVLYTGNGSTNAITGVGFDLSSDGGLVWIKNRTSGYSHGLYDTVRGTGTTKSLSSNITGQEGFYSSYHNLVSFDSDGFTLGSTSLTNGLNASGQSHVAWNWKAGGTAVSNTDGSITSQVSANTDAGFSIVSYTGTGSADTVGHGLNSTPELIITKQRSSSNPWPVNSGTLFSSGNMMFFDRTDAQVFGGSNALASYSNTTFGVAAQGATGAINDSGETYIAYCFANSDTTKAGSYTGNGSSNGPFVYTGFRPAWVIFKCTSLSGSQWVIYDAVRDSFNPVDNYLGPNRENAEGVDSVFDVDFTANGFKIRNSDIAWNTSGASYIYLAFAETPLKFATAR